jgi:hypothetical protein
LHDIRWKRVKGDPEPVYCQGEAVGQIRKFDTRLQIEFLGGYMSERFKRPWMQVNVAAKSDVFVLTEEQRHELIEINRQWLLEHPQEKTVGQNVQQQP